MDPEQFRQWLSNCSSSFDEDECVTITTDTFSKGPSEFKGQQCEPVFKDGVNTSREISKIVHEGSKEYDPILLGQCVRPKTNKFLGNRVLLDSEKSQEDVSIRKAASLSLNSMSLDDKYNDDKNNEWMHGIQEVNGSMAFHIPPRSLNQSETTFKKSERSKSVASTDILNSSVTDLDMMLSDTLLKLNVVDDAESKRDKSLLYDFQDLVPSKTSEKNFGIDETHLRRKESLESLPSDVLGYETDIKPKPGIKPKPFMLNGSHKKDGDFNLSTEVLVIKTEDKPKPEIKTKPFKLSDSNKKDSDFPRTDQVKSSVDPESVKTDDLGTGTKATDFSFNTCHLKTVPSYSQLKKSLMSGVKTKPPINTSVIEPYVENEREIKIKSLTSETNENTTKPEELAANTEPEPNNYSIECKQEPKEDNEKSGNMKRAKPRKARTKSKDIPAKSSELPTPKQTPKEAPAETKASKQKSGKTKETQARTKSGVKLKELRPMFAGHERFHKEAFIIVNWSRSDLVMTSNDDVMKYLQEVAQMICYQYEFSVENVRPLDWQREHDISGAAVVKVQDKHCAKIFRDAINAHTDNIGLTASSQTISQSHISNISAAHLESIEDAVETPLWQHIAEINKYENNVDQLRINAGRMAFHEIGSVMEEIAAIEAKIKELTKQRDVFKAFVDNVKEKLSNLKFAAQRHDITAEEIRDTFDRELKRFKAALPMYAFKSEIEKLMKDSQVSVIIGETGSGKSTQLAQYLYESHILAKQNIVCTQPRKVAATSLAKRVAEEMNCAVGKLVGYNVGMNQVQSSHTKIKYMTDHSLLKECLKDQLLSAYGCIIVDEAHERSIYTDLLLAMIKKILPKRPELKVVITSATINPKVFVDYFKVCPVLRIPGRTYPVEVFYDKQDHIDDYMQCAISKAVEVHSRYDMGDILVFMTTPLETEKACEQLQSRMKSQNVMILPLHGQLQAKEQNRVFEQLDPSTRKIVFATNCAETSLTIQGIKYVIDSGLAKERVYDSKRSVNALKLVQITQSSAEQRKGRAGRTQAGMCFRLYTEESYKKLRHNSTPEIMTMHLGQAFLQLMTLNISDPLSFDFVESPPRESLIKAMDLLEQLGAVKDGKLTDFGKKLSKVGLEPRLGKFLLDGFEKGIGKEAVIAGAMYTTGVNLFFRPKNDEEKETADCIKTIFCKRQGDLLTLLHVYKLWESVEDRQKNKWCNKNSINAKSARIVRDSVKEIAYTLNKELKMVVPKEYSDNEEVKRAVPELLLGCYSANVAMYLDHPRAGYILPFDGMQTATIHPSSALQYLDETPQWVIFESVLKTSKDFLISVTALDEKLVLDEIGSGKIDVDLEELKKRIIRPCELETYPGKQVLGKLIGPRYTTLKGIENSIALKTNDYVSIQKNENGQLSILVPEKDHACAKNILQEKVDVARDEMRKETIEVNVEENCAVRIALNHGCTIGNFLLPNEFVSVFVDKAPENMTVEEIKAYFGYCGTVLKCVKFQTKSEKSNNRPRTARSWGVITFRTHAEAKRALDLNREGESNIHVRPDRVSNGLDVSFTMPFCFKVEWCRRPKVGRAIVKIQDSVYAALCLSNVTSMSVEGSKVYPGKHNPDSEMFIPRVSPDTTAQDIIRCIRRSVGCTGLIRESDVIFPRAQAYPSRNEHADFQQKLESICLEQCNIPKEKFCITVRPVSDKNFYLTAYVRLADPRKVTDLKRNLKYSTFKNRQPEVSMELKASCTFRSEVYRVVKDDLERVKYRYTVQDSDSDASDTETDYSVVIFHEDTLRNNMRRLTITAQSVAMLQEVREVITEIIEGYEIESSHEFVSYLFTREGKSFLQRIEKMSQVYIYASQRGTKLVIYGPGEGTLRASEIIKMQVEHIKKLRISDIDLRNMPGIIKTLFKKYGLGLEALVQKVGASQLELILRRRVLQFQGTEAALEKLHEELKTCNDGRAIGNNAEDNSLPDCPICFVSVEKDDKHVLECCGHVYCKECIRNLILNGIKSKQFPIACAAEDCDEGIAIFDVKTLIGATTRELSELIKAAIDDMVGKSKGEYKYCVTPCDAVYKATKLGEDDSASKCYKCERIICTTCGVEYHTGVSCYIHQGRTDDPDYDIKLYMKRKKTIVCEDCGRAFQKADGCNHMTCPCGAHYCWKCHKKFATGNDVYDHQYSCPGKPPNH